VKHELDPVGILNPSKLAFEDRLGTGSPPCPPTARSPTTD
jgi:hypothetical protein